MRLLIRLTFGLGVFALLILGLLIVFVTSLDPNDYKEDIAAKVAERTGRELSINGDISVSFYPWLGVTVDDIRLGNAKGFGDEPFFDAKTVRARVKLIPLLRENLEVDTFILHGATLNLARNAEGVNNWDDLIGPEEADTEEEPGAAYPGAVILGGIDVKDASLHWQDAQEGVSYRISNADISTGALTLGEPIDIKASLTAVASKPALSSTMTLNGTVKYDEGGDALLLKPVELNAKVKGKQVPGGEAQVKLVSEVRLDVNSDSIQLDVFELSAFDSQVKGKLAGTEMGSGEPRLSGSLEAKSQNLPRLFKIAEIEPVASQLAKAKHKQFDLKTRFNADLARDDINIDQLDLNILGNRIKAEIHARNIKSTVPVVSGELKATGPDLPLVLQVAGAVQGKASPLSALATDFGKLKNKKFDVDTKFNVDLKSGEVDIPSLNLTALGVVVTGRVKGEDVHKKKGSMDGNIAVTAKQPGPLLRTFGQTGLSKVVQSVDIKAGITGNWNKLNLKPLTVKSVFSGKDIPNSPVTLVVNADTALDQSAQNLKMDRFSVAGLGLDIKGQLDVKQYNDDPAVKGQIGVAPFDLKKLMASLNQTPLATTDPKAFSQVAFESDFTGTRKGLSMKKFNAVLDESQIEGNVNVNDFSKSEYEFGIGVDKINIDRYLPPKAKDKPKTPETAAVGAATALPLETLRAINVKGDVRVGELVASDAKLTDVALSIKAKDGDIALSPISAKLYGGSYRGAIALDAKGKTPTLTMKTGFSNVNVEPLLTDLVGSAQLKGTGDIILELNSSGKDLNVLRNTLAGNGKIDFRNGVLKGLDIHSILSQIEVMYESKRIGKVDNGEQTAFDSLTGTVNIKNGIVNNDDLLIKAPGFKVNGKGMLLNLKDETWKYKFSVTVDESTTTRGKKHYNLGGYSLGVTCRGKIVDKLCLPDLDSIFEALFKESLGATIKKAIDLPLDIFPGAGGGETAKKPSTDEQKQERKQKQEKAEPIDPAGEIIKGVLDKLF